MLEPADGPPCRCRPGERKCFPCAEREFEELKQRLRENPELDEDEDPELEGKPLELPTPDEREGRRRKLKDGSPLQGGRTTRTTRDGSRWGRAGGGWRRGAE